MVWFIQQPSEKLSESIDSLDEKSRNSHHPERRVALLLTLERMAVPDRVRLMSSVSRQDLTPVISVEKASE